MTNNNQVIDLVSTQATIHRGCNRAWLQNHPSMLRAGFVPNARYDIEYGEDSVMLRLNPEGKRKVSATARGATIDLVNKKMNAYNFSNGVNWVITESAIIIMGDWVSDFLTVARFAEYYGVSEDIAYSVISLGRKTNYNH